MRLINLGRNLVRQATTAAFENARSSRGTIKNRTIFYGAVSGIGVGSAFGAYYAWDEWKKRQITISNPEGQNNYLIDSKPDITPSRIVKYPLDTTGLTLTLFQYQTCPFCCKVRAMLDYFGISYKIVEVNPVLRTQLKWSTSYRKVPILIVETPEGEIVQLNDSSMIISTLASYLIGSRAGDRVSSTNEDKGKNSLTQISSCYPLIKYPNDNGVEVSEIMNRYFLMLDEDNSRPKEEVINERKWRIWADSVFVHTLSPNIYRTIPEAVDSFTYFDKVGEWEKNFSSWERYLVIYVGAVAMWLVGKRLQSRHKLNADVRKSLYEESEVWMRGIKTNGKGEFMGGAKPNLADLAVFGVLSSIEGCEAFGDLAKNSTIISWYQKVKQQVKHNSNNTI